MKTVFYAVLTILALTLPAGAAERRIALVVGNANYQTGSLPTPANDAGLVAQTLQAAGFDVTGARDLDQETLRRAFRDFLDKASSSGPDTVAYIYLSGYGVQLEGENYFVPVDARIANDTSVSVEALRLSDYVRPLAALHLKTTVIVLDLARANPFARSGNPLTGGLALVDAEPGTLIAFNATPGTIAPDEAGPYSGYAQALAEISREGGLPIDDVFARVRLRVNQITNGGQVPWHASKLQAPIDLFERAPDAPPPQVTAEQTLSLRQRPIREFDAREAYLAALDRDSLEAYEDFLAIYPNDPMARRVRAIVAARREAITWRRTRTIDTPQAYWSYLRRYPRGRHAYEARRRLAFLSAVVDPPPSFAFIDYEVPPPPPEEFIYVERRVLVFDDPVFAFAPPPPPPLIFLAPRPPEFVILLAPPPRPVALFVLPIPIYRPVPVWVRPPVYVAPPPPNNVIFNNIHNTVVINNTTNVVTITNHSGQTTTLSPPTQPPTAGTPHPPAGAIGPALPPSVAQKASESPQGPQLQLPGQSTPPPAGHVLPGHPLPGMKGVPLPIVPPVGPAQPSQPTIKPPGTPSQTVQPLPKGQTPPAAKNIPPTVPAPGQPLTKQPGQPPQPGQAQPLPKAPVLQKGTPPTAAPSTGQPAVKQPGSQQLQPGQGQPAPKDQGLLTPKALPPTGAPPAQKHQLDLEQQRQKQIELQKQQQEQQRQRQVEQQRQQQLEQRQRQIEQQRQQQEQQRQRQIEQQRQQQIQQQEQQRQRQVEQQRQQQLEQRQRQIEQQRQQQEQERQRQIEQQRQQQIH